MTNKDSNNTTTTTTSSAKVRVCFIVNPTVDHAELIQRIKTLGAWIKISKHETLISVILKTNPKQNKNK